MQVSVLKGGAHGQRCGIRIFLEFCGQIPDPWDWKIVQI